MPQMSIFDRFHRAACVEEPVDAWYTHVKIYTCGFRSLYVFLLNLCANFKIKVNKNEAVKHKEYQDTII